MDTRSWDGGDKLARRHFAFTCQVTWKNVESHIHGDPLNERLSGQCFLKASAIITAWSQLGQSSRQSVGIFKLLDRSWCQNLWYHGVGSYILKAQLQVFVIFRSLYFPAFCLLLWSGFVLFHFVCFLETGSQYVAHCGLELYLAQGILNSWCSSYLNLQRPRITGVHHHASL